MRDAPISLVLDTNVVLDLFHFADPRLAPIAAAVRDGRARCHADAEGLAELRRVLAYPEFRLDAAAADSRYARYLAIVSLAEPGDGDSALIESLPRCRDPDDQKFISLAVRLGARYLVSRDRAVLALARRIRRLVPMLEITTPESLSKLLSGTAVTDRPGPSASANPGSPPVKSRPLGQ